jgi:deazaflavin-dependent oxidoreductase (nitroreductase family)
MTIERYIPYPREGVLRGLMRLPLLGYRLGLGGALNALGVMILITRGRSSGAPRPVPIAYQMHGSKVYIVSGWGDRPQWYQNILHHPGVTVQRGGLVYAAEAIPVTHSGEALRVLHLFRRRAPGVYDALIARLSDRPTIDERSLHEVTDRFTIVRLERRSGDPDLPPVQVDYGWAAPAAALSGALLLLVGLAMALRRRT